MRGSLGLWCWLCVLKYSVMQSMCLLDTHRYCGTYISISTYAIHVYICVDIHMCTYYMLLNVPTIL